MFEKMCCSYNTKKRLDRKVNVHFGTRKTNEKNANIYDLNSVCEAKIIAI